MRVLLDTNAILWLTSDTRRLSARARRTLEDPENTPVVSSVSVAEVVIKARTGRLIFPTTVAAFFRAATTEFGLEMLPLTPEHALRLERLPPVHADPFDRLLVAQAVEERVPMVTADGILAAYPIDVIW